VSKEHITENSARGSFREARDCTEQPTHVHPLSTMHVAIAVPRSHDIALVPRTRDVGGTQTSGYVDMSLEIVMRNRTMYLVSPGNTVTEYCLTLQV